MTTDIFKRAFDGAFARVVRAFPFRGYVDSCCYHEMFCVLKALRVHLHQFQDKRLLDIGAGPMEKTGILQELGFRCTATDDLQDPWHLQGNNITAIKRYAEQLGIQFYHQKENDYSIPFEEGSFDVVMSLSVIEHLHESPRNLLNTLGRYLRVGGVLVVTTPNAVNLRKRISVLFGRSNYNPIEELYFSEGAYRGHVREYTLAELVYVCEQTGFEVVDSGTFEHYASAKLAFPLRQLYLLLGSLIKTFRSGIMVIARKPENWVPVADDIEKYRSAILKAVPRGVADDIWQEREDNSS